MGDLKTLHEMIVNCEACPRLKAYREEVARKKVKRYRDWDYWGKPVPGFGDRNPRLLIVGLAPAAHGANRTGRMFTGDSSGEWLAKALYETGFANQPLSKHRDDGFRLKGAYITAVVRCVPPENRPTAEEIEKCNRYLVEEIRLFENLKVILCLGEIAFRGVKRALEELFPEVNLKGLKFGHNGRFSPEGLPYVIYTSYHPSRQNTQTGRLKWKDWIEVFRRVKKELEERE